MLKFYKNPGAFLKLQAPEMKQVAYREHTDMRRHHTDLVTWVTRRSGFVHLWFNDHRMSGITPIPYFVKIRQLVEELT